MTATSEKMTAPRLTRVSVSPWNTSGVCDVSLFHSFSPLAKVVGVKTSQKVAPH